MNQFFVIPAAGLTIVNPVTKKHLPVGGAVVQDSYYWRNMERDGDVTIHPSDPSTAKKDTAPAPKPDQASNKV